MPEASPDPVPPRPTPPPATPPQGAAPAPTTGQAQQPQQARRDVQPRRFGLTAAIIFFVFIVAVVIATVFLSGGTGSQEVLQNNLGIDFDLRSVVFTFIEVIYGIAALVAVIYMLIGGFRAATSLGSSAICSSMTACASAYRPRPARWAASWSAAA